jgi:hypothetical protein
MSTVANEMFDIDVIAKDNHLINELQSHINRRMLNRELVGSFPIIGW